MTATNKGAPVLLHEDTETQTPVEDRGGVVPTIPPTGLASHLYRQAKLPVMALPFYGRDEAYERAPHTVQLASMARAAEAWRRHTSREGVIEDLNRELAAQRVAIRRAFIDTSHDVCASADWQRIAERPTLAELNRLRGYTPEGVAA